MSYTMKKEFLNRYHYVFDANGNLNPHCDKEDRKNFLELCYSIKPNVNFGDVETGEFCQNAIFELRRETLEEMLPLVYAEVFDEHGNMKPCGREKCIELIEICSTLDPFQYYGDRKRGFINEATVFKLRWRV